MTQRLNMAIEILPLTAGLTVAGSLEAGSRVDYHLDLDIQDAAVITCVANGLRGELIIIDPDGERVRGQEIDSVGNCSLAFVADMAGRYHVILAAVSATGGYSLTVAQVLPLEERIKAMPAPRLESVRIRRLREDLAANAAQALVSFWQEVERQGTPLLEPDPENDQLTLCTFLWRGKEHIRNVQVHLLFRTTLPNDYALTRLAGTDVWHTTIRLPSRGRFAYTMLTNTPPVAKPDIDSKPEHRQIYFASSQADPLNPRRRFDEQGSRYETMSLLALPDAPLQPWTGERPAVDRGKLTRCSWQSKVLEDERFVTVYTPPGYSSREEPYGLLFVFDEPWYLARVPTPTILDNLLADKKIPPMVAILIGNGPGEARSRQLPCNPLWAEFMDKELVPWVRAEYNVTVNPRRIIVAGSSYGGLAATYVALRHPELFGNVLSQSGSYWWQPPAEPKKLAGLYPERNYIASLFVQSPRLALRFYLEAGWGEIDPSGKGRSILDTNRHLRDVLLAKGYEVHYQEFAGGHDFLSWRGMLADGLILLTEDSKKQSGVKGSRDAFFSDRRIP